MQDSDLEIRRKIKLAARKHRLRLSRKHVDQIANAPELGDLAAIEEFILRLSVFSQGLRRRVSPEMIADALLPSEELIAREQAAGDVPRIFAAIENGDVQEVEELLRKGIELEVTAAHQEGMTPLLLALFQRDAKIAELLLNAGADPHNKGDHSSPPIHWAAHNKHCLALLLEAGADVNAFDDRGAEARR